MLAITVVEAGEELALKFEISGTEMSDIEEQILFDLAKE